jgi:hypothetical protein
MQKHIGNELPRMIKLRTKMMQCKKVFDGNQVLPNGDLCQPDQSIDNDEILYYYW